MFVSDKKKQAADLDRQRSEGVTGSHKRRYHFTLKQQHWIAPGYLTRHEITGQYDCGLQNTHPGGLQTWSIELRNLRFDWNPHAAAEIYYLFAYPSRMDIHIDKDGTLTGGITPVDCRERWNRQYKNDISLRLKDDKERAGNLLRALGGSRNNDKLALGLLASNPLVTALCNMVKLNYNLNKRNEQAGAFGERFTGEIVKPHYFSENIHLPLKTTWLQRQPENEDLQEWTHLGGLIKEKYREDELRKMLRMITGNQNPETDVQVEFAEMYRMEPVTDDFLQIGYALLQTETVLTDTWVKSEELEMITDEKGVVYGTE